MVFKMRLDDSPFKKIQSGTKDIEMRLSDEKRRQIKLKDDIDFENRDTGEHLLTEVVGLHMFSSFDDLYVAFDKTRLGYGRTEVANPKDMEAYYPKEKIDHYGVVGIEFRLKM